MNQKDQEALAAIQHTAEQDALVREDIERTLEDRDRASFEQVVYRVIDRLSLPIPDVKGFMNGAYEWFRDRHNALSQEEEPMEECPQCGRRCRTLHTMLVLGRGGLSAWRVECCGKCKPFYQGHNARKRKRQQRQYDRKR